MAFTNYAGLQDEIRSFLWDRTDVVAKVPSFITLAESEMRRELKTQQSVLSRPFSVAFGQAALPSDERQILSITLDYDGGTHDLDYATPEQLAQWNETQPGRPRFYTIEGNRIRVLPEPNDTYSGTIRYRAAFEALSDANTTNWILERHPDIYLCGALKWAKAWLIDSDQDWASPFYAAIDAANRDQPMRQGNSKLRADEATMMSHRRAGWDWRTGGY